MYFLIGHRGVGKTTAVESVEGGLDLDTEISKKHDIRSFFAKGREKKFRDVERAVLTEVLASSVVGVIALGAGFELDKFDFPEEAKFIWLQRCSDHVGRVFLNRPRLEQGKSQLDEFQGRHAARESLYGKYADFFLESEEGGSTSRDFRSLMRKKLKSCRHGFYTLRRKTELGFLNTQLELRTDFFEEEEIKNILKTQKKHVSLIALRKEPTEEFLNFLSTAEKILIDVPLDFVGKKYLEKLGDAKIFLSEHDFISIEEIKFFNEKGFHIKWAPEVESFEELVEFHAAVEELDVSFLPRSVGDFKGRWNWYRQRTFFDNKISFFRYGLNEYLDQPSHYEIFEFKKKDSVHGAVIGSDVSLSHSPSFHRKFMLDQFKGSYLRVSLYKDEFVRANLGFLVHLGVSIFSVSSPFKEDLGEMCGVGEPLNTLYISNYLDATDTDACSIDLLADRLVGFDRVLVWGAGAIGSAIAKRLGSKAVLQSVRNYKEGGLLDLVFDAVVWSAGSECLLTPELKQSPKILFDIEYKEHSQAKVVALHWGCAYISGEEFFEIQALAQQKFWLECKADLAGS